MKPVLVVIALFAAFAFPAGAAAPPPKQQIAQLKRQVAQLKKENTRLERARLLSSGFTQDVVGVLMHRIGLGDKCALTTPNLRPPPGQLFGVPHGNGKLWVGTWASNVVFQKPQADGWIDAKFGWYRAVRGQLTIEAHRLDADAPPARSSVPFGYGDGGFQSSGVIFPTEGCWQVTGHVGNTSLTFVTVVLKRPDV
jgi:hypothetical protein